MSNEAAGGTAIPGGVDALASMAPGVALAQLLDSIDVSEVRSDFAVLETMAAWERVICWAHAQQLATVAEFVRRPALIGPDEEAGWAARGSLGSVAREFADDEIGVRLGISRVVAASRIDVATSLATPLQATGAALAAGHIDFPKARVIVEGTRGFDVDAVHEVEARVLPNAPQQNCGRLARSLRRAVIAADPPGAHRRAKKARLQRKVFVRPLPDDMAELYALLPALQAAAIDTALTAAARSMKANRAPGDRRTIDQLRADALAAPFEAGLRTGVLETPATAGQQIRLANVRGAKAQLNVTVPASVLLGISDAPGSLAGYGPITAETARLVATDATWRRILTDPASGTVLDVGTTTYRPPAPLDRHVKMRDGTCRGSGCNWPARLCELDHTVPFPEGPTAADNLGPFMQTASPGQGPPQPQAHAAVAGRLRVDLSDRAHLFGAARARRAAARRGSDDPRPSVTRDSAPADSTAGDYETSAPEEATTRPTANHESAIGSRAASERRPARRR